MLTFIYLLNALLNGVRVLTEDIKALAKPRTDSRGACLLRPAIAGALRRTQIVAGHDAAP